MNTSAYRVAMVTEPPVYLDLQASVAKACRLIAEAAQNGAKLVVFGESWLPGYPFWVWLRSVPESLPLTARLAANSLVIDSGETRELCRAASEANVHVVMGINERAGGTLYNSLLFIDNKGNIPQVRRKLRPTGAERLVWGTGDGSTLAVVPTAELGVLGGALCWEHTMPGLDAAFCAQGEQVHVSAWPSFCLDLDYSLGQQANVALGQAWAIRTQSFVINVATVMTEEIVDFVCQSEHDRALFRTGGGYAQVFGPNGAPVNNSPDEHEAGITYAEIDPGLTMIAKMICDSAGHYARPDVVSVTVNKARRQLVTFQEAELIEQA